MKRDILGCQAVTDLSPGRETDHRPAVAWLDGRYAGRAIRRDPQDLAAPVPGETERVQRLGQGRDRPAGPGAGQNLPVENARHPDGRAVAGDAFDEAAPWLDSENCPRLGGRRCSEGQQPDQRNAPPTSFCSLEWMALDAATY